MIDIDPVPDAAAAVYGPEDIPLEVVFEDDTLLVVNKRAGLVVHPGSGNWQGTLLNALLRRVPALAGIPRAGIVHRLDKDTAACWWWRRPSPRSEPDASTLARRAR